MPLYYYNIVLNTHLFLAPYYPFSYPSKKKQLFFIHFAFSLSISKKVLCCVVDICICLLCDNTCNYQKKEKVQCQRCGLTCNSDNKTDERFHHRRNRRKKIGMNKTRINYFVRIILNPSLYFQRVF